jgi:hypothetical protein
MRLGSSISASFDWTKSTEENYRDDASRWEDEGGKFRDARALLDMNYHAPYTRARRRLQDEIVKRLLDSATDGSSVAANKRREGNEAIQWAVFTAGAMGAGKTHCLRTLAERGLFPPLPNSTLAASQLTSPSSVGQPPLTSSSRQLHPAPSKASGRAGFVHVDPDVIRYLLPEMAGYLERDPETAGTLTHKESCLVAEVLTLAALRDERCLSVVVDGSLRDTEWYSDLFRRIRAGDLSHRNHDVVSDGDCGIHSGSQKGRNLGNSTGSIEHSKKDTATAQARMASNKRGTHIAIIHMVANASEVLARASRRAAATGRAIPLEKLRLSIEKVPGSVDALEPLADITITINTDGPDPVIIRSTLGKESGVAGLLSSCIGENKDETGTLSWSAFARLWQLCS